ncbi:MAG TPA: hypothetical protein VFW22_01190 [Pseudolabrys sp.]|nr:hypothetical protein [Pseudolabrys sp.]
MRQANSAARSWLFLPLAAALVVIGVKCWMIGRFGNPTPFWDQWDAEGAFLYPKYLGGTLSLGDLLAAHNEHRILFTRLWSLLLLVLEGYWDPIVQMLANTLLSGAIAALFITAFRALMPRTAWIGFALFATLTFALPWTWGTTLEGFNSQWYFMLLFGIAGMMAICGAPAFAPRWWAAVLLLLADYFSMAGGVSTTAAAFSLCAVQAAAGSRRGVKELSALGVLAALAAAMILSIPMLARHAPLKAHSVGQFFQALVEIMSWPAATGVTFLATLVVLAAVTQAPAWLTSVGVIRARPAQADRRWFLVAMTFWTVWQISAVAYGRGVASITARYLDLYSVGLLVNAACLFYLVSTHPVFQRQRRLAIVALALWLLPVSVGITLTAVKHTTRDLVEKRDIGRAETENLRAFLASGDVRALEDKPDLQIPYPDPHRLADIASQPAIRAILPPVLVGEESAKRAQAHGIARYTGGAVEAIKDIASRWGFLLIPLGLALFLVGIKRQRDAKTA